MLSKQYSRPTELMLSHEPVSVVVYVLWSKLSFCLAGGSEHDCATLVRDPQACWIQYPVTDSFGSQLLFDLFIVLLLFMKLRRNIWEKHHLLVFVDLPFLSRCWINTLAAFTLQVQMLNSDFLNKSDFFVCLFTRQIKSDSKRALV